MNLAKFLKGTTTIKELESMPVSHIHVIYREYFNTMRDPNRRKENAEEQIQDQIEEEMTGG